MSQNIVHHFGANAEVKRNRGFMCKHTLPVHPEPQGTN